MTNNIVTQPMELETFKSVISQHSRNKSAKKQEFPAFQSTLTHVHRGVPFTYMKSNTVTHIPVTYNICKCDLLYENLTCSARIEF